MSAKTDRIPAHRNISIWLDTYDDIFSDFDSRPYSDRVLSDDFTREVAQVCAESSLAVHELRLLLPEQSRHKDDEAVITHRLQSYFRNNVEYGLSIRRKTILRGILLLCAGLILMVCASLISKHRIDSVIYDVLFIILEPGGWFLVWTALDELYYGLRKRRAKLAFYTKMAHCKVTFLSITS